MNIHTVEQNFEYQMGNLLAQFCKEEEISPKNGEELFKKLWENKEAVGDLLYAFLGDYMEEDDWLVQAQENE